MTKQSLPELIQKSAEKKLTKYCDEKIPPHVKDRDPTKDEVAELIDGVDKGIKTVH